MPKALVANDAQPCEVVCHPLSPLVGVGKCWTANSTCTVSITGRCRAHTKPSLTFLFSKLGSELFKQMQVFSLRAAPVASQPHVVIISFFSDDVRRRRTVIRFILITCSFVLCVDMLSSTSVKNEVKTSLYPFGLDCTWRS